jgi:alcohol dehydrogenase class IV
MIDKSVAEMYKTPKHVRLGTKHIAVEGEILEVRENCILFKSNKGVSAISLESIDTIMCVGGGEMKG